MLVNVDIFLFSFFLVFWFIWHTEESFFFSQSTCKSPKKSVLKIDPPLYSISFCSFSRDYLWTSFEPNRSTEKDILQCVIDAMVWKFVNIVRRGISTEFKMFLSLGIVKKIWEKMHFFENVLQKNEFFKNRSKYQNSPSSLRR